MQDYADNERISLVSDMLYDASRSIRILSRLAWGPEVRESFLASHGCELPQVQYKPFDSSKPLALVAQAKQHIKHSAVDDWLLRLCSVIENSAKMLESCGTTDFFKYSSELYGTPMSFQNDGETTSLDLAQQFDRHVDAIAGIDIGEPPEACHLAQTVADEMQKAVDRMFKDEAPKIQIVDELSANALAGPSRIRLRRTACFTDKDIAQLINHEAYIHVATSLNGHAQTDLKILGAGHPGTTKTQEGLAVFAEFITGSIDIDRMRRLADRVIAIQMAVDGANFIDVYRYYLERTGAKEQSFENARRVFRGGVMEGGAPFTKDGVYLDGLVRVHNFLRTIVSTGRADCLHYLFCGKLGIEDIPVMHELTERGLCKPPKYLPPWALDMRFLLCYLSYSSFLNGVDLSSIKSYYNELLSSIPRTDQR